MYDSLYRGGAEYNGVANGPQLAWVIQRAGSPRSGWRRVYDVGCGRGHVTRGLRHLGFTVFPFDFSKELQRKHWAEDRSFVLFDLTKPQCPGTQRADFVVCTDVLEHLRPEDIPVAVENLRMLSGRCLLAIANHSDVKDGVELHLIQEGVEWWCEKLGPFTLMEEAAISPRLIMLDVEWA